MRRALAALLLLGASCGAPPPPASPVDARPSAPRPAPEPSAETPPAEAPLDDAVLTRWHAEPFVMGDPLPSDVTAQRGALTRWLGAVDPTTDAEAMPSPDELRARLRAAGAMQLAEADAYLPFTTHSDEGVVGEARIAWRRRANLHRPRFRRLAVLGASVSAGFIGRSVASWLEETLPEAAIEDLSSAFLFREDRAARALRIRELERLEPEITFALDELFWWSHGRYRHRIALGLADLDGAPGLLVVGTVPRMTGAKSWMLGRVPSAAHLDEVNRHIVAWAAARPRVVLVPLAAWYRELGSGEVAPLPGDAPVPGDELFAPDGLHLSQRGSQLVLRRVSALLAAELPDVPAQTFVVPW